MWDETIPSDGSYFPDKHEACWVSDVRKCEFKGGIVQCHIFGPDWL